MPIPYSVYMSQLAIIYATRFGATQGVAERIGEIARGQNHHVDVFDAKKISKLDFSSYDGVIIGGGIQIGKIPGSLKKILQKFNTSFNQFQEKFALFLCCGAAQDEAGKKEATEKYLLPLLQEYDLTPGTTATFGGYYDLRKNSKFGKIKSAMIRKMIENDSPGKFDLNGMNDLRDWDKIENWAKKFLDNF